MKKFVYELLRFLSKHKADSGEVKCILQFETADELHNFIMEVKMHWPKDWPLPADVRKMYFDNVNLILEEKAHDPM